MRTLNYDEAQTVKAIIRERGNYLARRQGKIISEEGVEKIYRYGLANTQRCKVSMEKLGDKFYYAFFHAFRDEMSSLFVDASEPTPAPAPAPAPAPVSEPTPASEPVSEAETEDEDEDIIIETENQANASVTPFVDYIKGELRADMHKIVDEAIKGLSPREVVVKTATQSNPVEGVTHPQFETVLQFVSADIPVYLYGPAGTGKNHLCKQIADGLGLKFYSSNAVTEEFKLTGFIDANGLYHETEFYKAFTQGGLFFLDEMDASIPEVLIILNGAIANRYFEFPTGRVNAHPDFRVISAGNTCGTGATYVYNGRNQLDGASLDRFAMIPIDYDERIELYQANGDENLVKFIHALRKASAKAGVQMTLTYRGIHNLATMTPLIGLDMAMRYCIVKGMDKADLTTVVGSLDCYNQYGEAIRTIAQE